MGANCGSNSSFYYSFDTPLIHWITFSGETWTMSKQQLQAQDAWVRADLAKVDRSVTPWVVAFSHKSCACFDARHPAHVRPTHARPNARKHTLATTQI
jgi:hypothetical protein